MAAFLVAQIDIRDRATYSKYGSAVDATLVPYDGKILSVEENPNVLEGNWNYTRTVLIQFPSKERAMAWYASPEYQAIVRLRLAASTGNLAIVDGQ